MTLGVVLLALIVVSGWVFTSVDATMKGDAPITVTIAKGAGIRDVSARLEASGVISSQQAWTLFALVTDQAKSILPGTYTIQPQSSGRDILRQITSESNVEKDIAVTILEGWTLKQIAAELETKGIVNAQEFLNIAQHPATSGLDLTKYAIVSQKPSSVDLEGYLFPDTYRFFRRTDPKVVIGKMLENLDTRYSAVLRADTASSGHTIHEILTMASILEKELTTASDRAKGSDVFWKRISVGMPLQSNVTIMYAMGLTEDRLSIADTKFESPYNTYKYKGLPPGPINNPGLVSIEAAIHPEKNQFYYFLASPAGVTYFAKTLEEHNAYKAKYLK